MPSVDQAYEDLEEDRAIREREIRLIERYLSEADDEGDRAMLARSLVLLTYAHLEGFTKFALLTYASVINGMQLACRDAALPLVAASLNQVFTAMGNVNAKHRLFADLPSDDAVHIQARRLRFIEQYDSVMDEVVAIPDKAIDTSQNLNSRTLKRALFQLGLNYPAIDEHNHTLNRLLGERNAIAHGDRLNRPKDTDVQAYLSMTFKVMLFIQQEVFQALSSGAYQRKAVNDD